jgi:hypothetical protein
MTSIPGIGQNNEGIQFHDIFIPRTGALGAVVKADLPGDPTYWNEQTITLGADNWKIVTGTFPEGLAGDYWHRRFFLSHGQFPRIDATFEYHSAMFDQVLELVEMDGSQGGPEEPLSEYGLKERLGLPPSGVRKKHRKLIPYFTCLLRSTYQSVR